MTVQKAGVYKKLVLRETVCGMIFVGNITKSGLYAALIRYGMDISQVKDKFA